MHADFVALDSNLKFKRKYKVIDGMIGLAPWKSDAETKEWNTLYQLKKRGYIDHMMFSVYLSLAQGNTTHLKIGSYDEEGIEGGLENMHFLDTASDDEWMIKMDTVKIGEDMVDIDIDFADPRFIIFELAYPYIYIPMTDFD